MPNKRLVPLFDRLPKHLCMPRKQEKGGGDHFYCSVINEHIRPSDEYILGKQVNNQYLTHPVESKFIVHCSRRLSLPRLSSLFFLRFVLKYTILVLLKARTRILIEAHSDFVWENVSDEKDTMYHRSGIVQGNCYSLTLS